MGTAFAYGGGRELEEICAEVNGIEHFAFIGAGVMGLPLGELVLEKSNAIVTWIDTNEEHRTEVERRLRDDIGARNDLTASRKADLLDRIRFTGDYGALRTTNGFWNAGPEDSETQAKIFHAIEQNVDPEKLVFGFSNTSSHTAEELGGHISDRMVREVLMLNHGNTPVKGNPWVDVVRGPYATERAFLAGRIFTEQVMERKVLAFNQDHPGYAEVCYFVGMNQMLARDIENPDRPGATIQDGNIWGLTTSNPFHILDMTGQMPYIDSAIHFGDALPDHDRFRGLYEGESRVPQWVLDLNAAGNKGGAEEGKDGFFQWEGTGSEKKRVGVWDPHEGDGGAYKPFESELPPRSTHTSFHEAREMDARNGEIKSLEGLVHIAQSSDQAGKDFRRYVTPLLLYALDLIQDGYTDVGVANSSSRGPLAFKRGLIEILDAFIGHVGIDGVLEHVRQAADDHRDLAEMGLYDVDGHVGPRQGRRSLLHTMKERGWDSLLGYGRVYGTPVEQRNIETGEMEPYYTDMRFEEPGRHRVGAAVFVNPKRRNVLSRQVLDQLDHIMKRAVDLHIDGDLGALEFVAEGENMMMAGADAKQFHRGWYDGEYDPISPEDAADITRKGARLFQFIEDSSIHTYGVAGQKFGGAMELFLHLDGRYELITMAPSKTGGDDVQNPTNTLPEAGYGICQGYRGAQKLVELGLDHLRDRMMHGGLTPEQAVSFGLSTFATSDEDELKHRAYQDAKIAARDAPYSVWLTNRQRRRARRGEDAIEPFARETGLTFSGANPQLDDGITTLINIGDKSKWRRMKYQLPDWMANPLRDIYDNLYGPAEPASFLDIAVPAA